MKDNKLFLIEKARIVIVRNEDAAEVSFRSLEEFAGYTPELDITRCFDYWYLDYRPDAGVHLYNWRTDERNSKLSKGPVPEPLFESIIAMFPILYQRKQDRFWGHSLNSAKTLALEVCQRETLGKIRTIASDLDIWRYEVGLLENTERVKRNADIKILLQNYDSTEQSIGVANSVEEIENLLAKDAELEEVSSSEESLKGVNSG